MLVLVPLALVRSAAPASGAGATSDATIRCRSCDALGTFGEPIFFHAARLLPWVGSITVPVTALGASPSACFTVTVTVRALTAPLMSGLPNRLRNTCRLFVVAVEPLTVANAASGLLTVLLLPGATREPDV